MRPFLLPAALGGSALLSACGFVYDERLAGPYRLVATDVREQMMVCVDIGGGDCVGDGLPGPTIFAAGADARYLVMARHPSTDIGRPDRSVTEYYYVVRGPDEPPRDLRAHVVGPLSRAEFEQARGTLRLPPFTRIFDDLK